MKKVTNGQAQNYEMGTNNNKKTHTIMKTNIGSGKIFIHLPSHKKENDSFLLG